MKWFSFLLILFTNQLMSQHAIYHVRYTSLDGGEVKMAAYMGKKIVVAAVSPDNLEKGGLAVLESLQAAHPEVTVIIVPSEDFGGRRNQEILKSLKERPSKRVQVSASSKVKKGPKTDQHPLLRWLTTGSENGHFNMDVSTDNQLYIISESGVLYAVLEKGVSPKVIDEALQVQAIPR